MGLAPGPAARSGHARRRRAATSPASWPGVPVQTGLDATRHPAGRGRRRASTCSCCSAPTRSATSPTATSPRRALAGARTVIAVDLFLTESASARPTSCCPPPASPRSRAPRPTSRAGSACSNQKVTPPGHRPPRLDDRRRAGRRLGADLGLESVDGIWARDRRAGARPTPALDLRAARRRRSPATASSCRSPMPAARPRRTSRRRRRGLPARGHRRHRRDRQAEPATADAGRRRRPTEADGDDDDDADGRRGARPTPVVADARRRWSTFVPGARARAGRRSTPTRCAWSPPASSTTRARCWPRPRRWPRWRPAPSSRSTPTTSTGSAWPPGTGCACRRHARDPHRRDRGRCRRAPRLGRRSYFNQPGLARRRH